MEDAELIDDNENSKEEMNTECNSKPSRLPEDKNHLSIFRFVDNLTYLVIKFFC